MSELGEPLTRQELVEALAGLDIGLTDPQPLKPQQARRVASLLWNRIQVHRNRAYQLGYLHGRNNHNSVCEDLVAPYVALEDVPTLFSLEESA